MKIFNFPNPNPCTLTETLMTAKQTPTYVHRHNEQICQGDLQAPV